MKLGAYTACLHDKPLPEALEILARARPDQRRDQLRRVPAAGAPPGRATCWPATAPGRSTSASSGTPASR